MISVSIVSHGHGHLLEKLVLKLLSFNQIQKIILTLNIPEKIKIPSSNRIIIIKNKNIYGFSENHNRAFKYNKSKYFCVLNPDIEFKNNPFPNLISQIEMNNLSLIAPMIKDINNNIEDSYRKFPTLFDLLLKFFFNYKGIYKSKNKLKNIFPDWIAGMFMLFDSSVFKKIKGFDSNFFLYYEDVDICIRLKKLKLKIMVDKNSYVIHDARRQSRKNIKFFLFHVKSLMLYLKKYLYRLPTNE